MHQDTFHVLPSLAAAGSLRLAMPGAAGRILGVADKLNVGPLSDGRQRFAFWQDMTRGYGFAHPLAGLGRPDAFSPWQALRDQVLQEQPRLLTVWAGTSGADYVFLRLACRWLEGVPIALAHVPIQEYHGHRCAAALEPAILARLINFARLIPEGTRHQYAREFDRLAARPELLRECDAHGKLHHRCLSRHDDLVLQSCSTQWQVASHVVGTAMSRCDTRNVLCDLFFSFRLQRLLDKGRLEADGACESLHTYRVRLASPAPRPDRHARARRTRT